MSYLPPGHDPFAAGERAPDVLVYFRAYCAFSALASAAGVVALAAVAASGFGHSARRTDDYVALGFCVVAALVCVALGAGHVLGALAPRRRWMHTFGLVLLVSSFFFQGCCFPLVVILLVQWTKPELRAWFEAKPLPGPEEGGPRAAL